MIDSHHLAAYNKITVNYNRDVEAFPLLRRIIEKITGEPCFYKSPTDMGVNRAGFGITDDNVVREAATQEIIRRFFRYSCEYAMGLVEKDTVERAELLMRGIGPIQTTDVLWHLRAKLLQKPENAAKARKAFSAEHQSNWLMAQLLPEKLQPAPCIGESHFECSETPCRNP